MSTQFDYKAAFEAEAAGDDEPQEIKVVDRSGEPYKDADGKPAVFYVLGQYSEKLREYDRREGKRTAKSLMIGQEMDADASWVNRLSVAITGWKLAIGGKEVKHSHESAVVILTAAPWLREQVSRAIVAPRDFFSKASGD